MLQVYIAVSIGAFITMGLYHLLTWFKLKSEVKNLVYFFLSLSVSSVVFFGYFPLFIKVTHSIYASMTMLSAMLIAFFFIILVGLLYDLKRYLSYCYKSGGLVISLAAIFAIAYPIIQHVFCLIAGYTLIIGYSVYFLALTALNIAKLEKSKRIWQFELCIIIGGVAATVGVSLYIMNITYSFYIFIAFYYYLLFTFANILTGDFYKNHIELENIVQQRTAELNSALTFKSNLLTTTAHHTKTPLTLIKNGFHSLFSLYPELESNRLLQMLKRNTELMTRDIVNIFDMAQLEQGKGLVGARRYFDFSEMLKDKLELFSNNAGLKGIDIRPAIEDGIFIEADDLALNRVIDNLLDNAIKYCNRGTTLKVDLKGDGSKVMLTVADDGPGIDKEELPHIFERYYQIEREKQVSSGLGLGLALTKEIIEELGGAIEVESEVGKGTTFRIELNRAFTQKEDESYRLTGPVKSMPVTVEACRRFKNGKTVMVVEDEPELLLYLRDELAESYNIIPAVSGREALELMERCRPDLIISDVMMAEIDGLGLKERLPAEFEHIPFIFLTAKSKESDKIEGLALGAVDYIYKPFNIEEIKFKVEHLLNSSEQFEALTVERILKAASRESKQIEEKGPSFEERCAEYGLTVREIEVTEALYEVETDEHAADRLFISPGTVKSHKKNIFKKVGVNSKKELFKKLF